MSHSGWGVAKCDGCPIYQGLLWPNGSALSAEERSCVRGDGEVLWVPLQLPPTPAPPPSVLGRRKWPSWVRMQPYRAWLGVDGGTAFLPWQNKPVRGQGGVQVTVSPFSTSSETHVLGSEPSGGDSPSLELGFRGSAVAVYVSTGPQGTNASVVLDGVDQQTMLVGKSEDVRHAQHVWLARGLPRASAHNISLRFEHGSGQLVISGVDIWT